MKRSSLVFVLAAFCFFSFASAALGQSMEFPPGKWWKRPKIVETLKIQSEQQQRLDEIFAKHRREFIDMKAEFERRHVDLEELLNKKDTDPKKIGAASEALEQARGRLGKARTMMIVEMKGVLTEVQWQKIQDARDRWRAEFSEEFRDRRQRPGGRRGPMGTPGPQDE